MFDPGTWGTVGQWVSAIGTTSAFLATFYVIRRDAKVRREQQARKVAFYVDVEVVAKKKHDLTLITLNLSEEPIYSPVIFALVDDAVNVVDQRAILLPGRRIETVVPAEQVLELEYAFRDNANRVWIRSTGGELAEIRWTLLLWLMKPFLRLSRFKEFRLLLNMGRSLR